MHKAKFTGKVRDKNGYAVHLFYEYRGREYMITDEHNGYSEPLWVKHKNEQDRIDKIIEEENRPRREVKYEDTGEYGFNLLWEFWEEVEKGPLE